MGHPSSSPTTAKASSNRTSGRKRASHPPAPETTSASRSPSPADGAAEFLRQIGPVYRRAQRDQNRTARHNERRRGRRAADGTAAIDVAAALAAVPRPPATPSAAELAALEASMQRRLLDRGVGKRYLNVALRSIPSWLPDGYVDLAAVLLKLIDRPQTMAIGGTRGMGKTALVSGLVREFSERGLYASVLTARSYVDRVRCAAFERKQSVIDGFCRADLLVLDEVQERPRDPGGDSIFVELVDARYANQLATVLVTNLAADPFFEFVGDSVKRRVVESGGYLMADWPRIEELRPAPQGGG